MKKILPVVAFLAIIYLIVSAIKNIWNPLQWFSMGSSVPANGTLCNDKNGNPGVYQGGTCIASGGSGNGGGSGDSGSAGQRTGWMTFQRWGRIGSKKIVYYSIAPGTICPARKYDPSFGWGLYYPALSTSTLCAYIF